MHQVAKEKGMDICRHTQHSGKRWKQKAEMVGMWYCRV